MSRALHALAVLALALPVWSQAADPAPPKLRLPTGVAPTRYASELWIDPSKETFEGRIEIGISLKEKTRTIWLHGKELEIKAVSAESAAGGESIPGTATSDGKDYLGLSFQRNLSPGAWKVVVTYKGRVDSKDSDGVFRQKEGADWYAFTHFEAIYARRAFPCFDEPAFKTPWQITIHVPKETIAVSNTPLVSEVAETDGGTKIVFAPTKPLPSYLVAFGVGPFDVVNAGTAGRKKVPIRMIVPKGRSSDARWAVESTGPILDTLEAYFDIPYPYEKLDQLVIPETNWLMENAGLVTYPSTVLLANPGNETVRFRRKYASFCAHETAHQWFGDYVTAAWWDDLWLNEAFATWMASKAMARWKPEWNEAVERAADRSSAMRADALVTARRIRQPIETEDDISNAFDWITYRKGAAVIGMFEGWVGEEGFRKGIQRYLKTYAWGNATADDFVASIAEATKTPAMVPAFRSFLDQPGVPLVTAELVCGGGTPRLLLSQKRFLPTGSSGSTKQTWRVPVCARAGEPGTERVCKLLTEPSGALALPGACPARVLANAGAGYYRILYSGSQLGEVLADGGGHLTASERVLTLSDVAALALGGEVPMATALSLVPTFANDPDRFVVESLQRVAWTSSEVLVTERTRPRFRRFVSDALGARAKELGWAGRTGETEDMQLLRTALVPFVASEGDEPRLVADATRLAKDWLKARSGIDPSMVSSVLGVAARYGDMELFQALLAEAKKSSDRQERRDLLNALGSFRDPAVVPAALALTLSSDFDAREAINVLYTQADDVETLPRAWDFLRANFDKLVERLPRETPAVFPELTTGFSDAARRAEVEAFFKDRAPKFLGGPRILEESLEQIHLRAALKAAQQESVNDFLGRYEPKAAIEVKPATGM